MNEENQLAISKAQMPWEDMERIAKAAAESGMFGITKPAQAICLFAICRSEGLDPIAALKRYHLIQGKPSMRAEAMVAEFLAAGGAVVWHIRTDAMAAATFFEKRSEVNQQTLILADQRFNILWELDGEEEQTTIIKLSTELAKLTRPGQETVFRSYADAEAKGLTKSREWNEKTKDWDIKDKVNWKQSPRQMLTARVSSEGIGVIRPSIRTGVYTPEEVQDFVVESVGGEVAQGKAGIEELLEKPKLSDRDREAMNTMIDSYLEQAKFASPVQASKLKGLASELRCKLQDDDLERDEIPMRHEPVAISEERIPWRDYVLNKVKSRKLIGRKLGEFDAKEIRVIAERGVMMETLGHKDPEIRLEASYIQEADKELNPEQYKEAGGEQSPFV